MDKWRDKILRAREIEEDRSGRTSDYVIVHPSVWTELCEDNYKTSPDLDGLKLAVCDDLTVPFVFATLIREEVEIDE